MEQVIRLLPDHIANQIAAGEVVQRPASVVKELMENAIDAGATRVDLLIKDAGKTLVQVIDNGTGMNPQDARMAFERHATSKIRTTEDLFNIRTMGFRGEAMASIAAVAQVHLKTRPHASELGTEVVIEGSDVKRHAAELCSAGTSIAVKNLFFNVPARRNFLKSNPVETRHVMNEFVRVAMAQPELGFSFEHNGHKVYDLKPTTLEGRIVQLFGKDLDGHLLPINELTPYVGIGGYIGTPEVARHKKGEQYFFVNRRFIKSHYLHHAINNAFSSLIPSDAQPYYFIFFEIDPAHVDINIHPTKTEIKFDDERTIYALLHSIIRKGLGAYHRAPLIQPIEEDQSISQLIQRTPLPGEDSPNLADRPESGGKSIWDDFYTQTPQTSPRTESHLGRQQPYTHYQPRETSSPRMLFPESERPATLPGTESLPDSKGDGLYYQLEGRYILYHGSAGLLLIDQHNAHQRVLYEQFLEADALGTLASQQMLFPQTLQFTPIDFSYMREIEQDVRALGFDLSETGNHSYMLHGMPAELKGSKVEKFFEEIIAEVRETGESDAKVKLGERLARSIAMRSALPAGKRLNAEEMRNLVERLLDCNHPAMTPTGKPTYQRLDLAGLDRFFQRNV
jgi:DNA mismatch repair protein MutL